MPFTLDIKVSLYKDGPIETFQVSGVPVDENEAIRMGLGREMYNGYIRSLTIAKQAKVRASAKAPVSGTRTRAGSAVQQAARARYEAMRQAQIEAAAAEAASDTTDETNAA